MIKVKTWAILGGEKERGLLREARIETKLMERGELVEVARLVRREKHYGWQILGGPIKRKGT